MKPLKTKKCNFYSFKYNTFSELDAWSQDLNFDFTLKDCLFDSVKLAKNADPDKYVCSGYSIGFHLHSEFLLHDGCVGKNVIIMVDTSYDMSIFDIIILHKYICSKQKVLKWKDMPCV